MPPSASGSADHRLHFHVDGHVGSLRFAEFVPGERLVMRTADGPFPMETSYTWQAPDPTRTRMTLRNRGQPAGFSRLAAPAIERAMRRATTKDLQKLKSILENS